ncbi:hypothetical protein [Paraburkholderia sp. BL6665CI2N2]|uniref:hypothetical protein n=1 Tax=Paraburkholderia sp. BL6665CI2N2 TaxID=1938806 RepID=UPI001066464D|nr:hypothetical protein [Paraburkholderia sp. BL6665CI2N2]
MRQGIVGNWKELAALLGDRRNSNRCAFIARHHGMFSLMGFNAQQISTLREKHSVYRPIQD